MRIKNIAIRATKKRESFFKKIWKETKALNKKIKKIRVEFDSLETELSRLDFLYRISEEGERKFYYYKTLRNAWVPKAKGLCVVCGKNKAYCQHHIVPLIKGGNNSDNNLIAICRSCHTKIHPFMAQ